MVRHQVQINNKEEEEDVINDGNNSITKKDMKY
jgi:hypothetical protein